MKLLNPIASIFGKKQGDSSENTNEEDDNSKPLKKEVAMDDHAIAKQHCKLFSTVAEVKTKLKKLEKAKEHITEERFQSLYEQYAGFLDKNTPVLKQIRDKIDQRLSFYVKEKQGAAHRFTEIKKTVSQEAKLLEAGVISKEDYLEKIKSLKPKEKECGKKYKSSQKQITLLKDAKNNKYVELEPDPESEMEDDEENKAKQPSGDTSSTDSVNSKDPADEENSSGDSGKNAQQEEKKYLGKEVDIKISPGAKLDVVIKDIAIPVTALFVGTERYEYIQITHPSPYNTVKGKLVQGNRLEFQCVFQGRRLFFASKIIEALTKPIRAVVLEYPEELAIKDLRSSNRIACRVPSRLIFKGKGKESIIDDLSPNGCHLEAIYQPSEKNYIARSSDTVNIECRFPGNTDCCTVSGSVRSVKKKLLTVLYGIQFVDISETTRSVINNYVAGDIS